MKYLLASILFFQFLLSSENIQLDESEFFKKQAEIQAIIDEQFPQKEVITGIEEIEDEDPLLSEVLDNEVIDYLITTIPSETVPLPTDHYEKAFVDELFINRQSAQSLYASYLKAPKIIFKNQRFKISLKTTVTTDKFDKIETRFIHQKNVVIINPKNEWTFGNKNNFYNSYYFKVQTPDFTMPRIQVLMYKEGKVFEIVTLKPKKIKYTNVADENENFSSVIAKKLEIITHKTKQYTNNQLLTILELKAEQGNLEDFHLKGFQEQGINSLEEDSSSQTALYYAIIPIYSKRVIFEYYNSELNDFVKLQSPVVLKNELVSTQTDLNPNKSNILLYKKILVGFFTILFFLLYLLRRRFLFIFLALIFLIIFVLYNLPNEMIKVKKGSSIYILPTNKSTVFYKMDRNDKVEILNRKDEFVKIFFKKIDENKEIIGWIKEKNIVKN
ncbi:MAG: hypothetical protein HRT43_01640 [Campylobacteraceae bacterium]|nr:hypothetical protein [Campylobacteraceae bacterium]